VATLQGHGAPVLDCVVMPDGHYAVSRSEDDKLKVWDLKARRCVDTAQGVGDFLFFPSNRDRDASSKAWMLYSSVPSPPGGGDSEAAAPQETSAPVPDRGSGRSVRAPGRTPPGGSRDTTYGAPPVALIGAQGPVDPIHVVSPGSPVADLRPTHAPPSATPMLSFPLQLMAVLNKTGSTTSLAAGEVPVPTPASLRNLLDAVLVEERDVDEFLEDYFAEVWAALDPRVDRRGKLAALCEHVSPVEVLQRLSEYDREAVTGYEYLLEYQ